MHELFRERDLTRVVFYQSLLEDAGISTFVKNENVSSMRGVSIPDYFPALCVIHDADIDAARNLIRNHLEETKNIPDTEIACVACDEMVPNSFETCWNCQAPMNTAKNE